MLCRKIHSPFKQYCEDVIPRVIKDWGDLSEDAQNQVKNVNEFFYGLHYVVGLADQAEASPKL